ncbi:MAG: methyltransferase domain-containing protein [Isosphaeraceae bacterium]
MTSASSRKLAFLAGAGWMLRSDVILGHVKGKKVLDCGGVDHWAFELKRSRGDWLHALVAEEAASCLGVDILDEQVDRINRLGKYRFETHNVEALPYEAEFDIVLAGEIVEHIYNMGSFLDSSWRALRPDGLLIITTPNAYASSFWAFAAMTRRERCHPEHTCYYSQQTLSYIVSKHGFAVEEFHLADRPARRRIVAALRSIIGLLIPVLREQLVLVARKLPSQEKYAGKW